MKTSDLKKLTGISILYFLLLLMLNIALASSWAATLCTSLILSVLLTYFEYTIEHKKVSLYVGHNKRKTIINRLEKLGYKKSSSIGDKTYYVHHAKNLLDQKAVLSNKDHFLELVLPDDLEKFFIPFRLKSRAA